MGKLKVALAVLLSALLPATAFASLLGSPVNLNTSETGTVTITPLGGPFSATVGSGSEFQICVGPNNNNCVTSGLTGVIDISANQVVFTFFGGTFSATGTFVIQLSGFNSTVNNVTLNSGSLASGNFGLTSFTASSMMFTGSVSGTSFAGGTVTFDVASGPAVSPTPLPNSIIFLITGMGGVALYTARRRFVHI